MASHGNVTAQLTNGDIFVYCNGMKTGASWVKKVGSKKFQIFAPNSCNFPTEEITGAQFFFILPLNFTKIRISSPIFCPKMFFQKYKICD